MLIDGVRNMPYLEAIQCHGGPGKRVLDLGCGTGFFTLAAAATGASVVAVELLDAVNVLPEVVRSNGYADRVQVYRGDVRQIELEPFDLVISDLRGNVPLYGDNMDVLIHVHEHLLAPGGVLLPFEDRMKLALVSLPGWYERCVRPWETLDDHDWSVYRRLSLAAPVKMQDVGADAVISDEATLGVVDYQDPASLSLRRHSFRSPLNATQSADAHGVILWFDALITAEGGYSTRPGADRPTYGRKLLPFQQPVALEAGQDVSVAVATMRVADEWQWEWQIGTGPARQKQNSLDALPVVAGDLAAHYGRGTDSDRTASDSGGRSDGPDGAVQRLL